MKKFKKIPPENFEVVLLVVIISTAFSITYPESSLLIDFLTLSFISISWIFLKFLYRNKRNKNEQ